MLIQHQLMHLSPYADGFSYPGYQTIFSGFGNMIIQGYSEAGFNIWMCLGYKLHNNLCMNLLLIEQMKSRNYHN